MIALAPLPHQIGRSSSLLVLRCLAAGCQITYTFGAMKKKAQQLTVNEAADSILEMFAEHAATLPERERNIRIYAFGKALTKAVKSHRPKPRRTLGTRLSRLLSRKHA